MDRNYSTVNEAKSDIARDRSQMDQVVDRVRAVQQETAELLDRTKQILQRLRGHTPPTTGGERNPEPPKAIPLGHMACFDDALNVIALMQKQHSSALSELEQIV